MDPLHDIKRTNIAGYVVRIEPGPPWLFPAVMAEIAEDQKRELHIQLSREATQVVGRLMAWGELGMDDMPDGSE